MKFLCDQMLGTLAKWLRIYGFDTFFANAEIDDDNLLTISINENRVLITRDKELVVRSKKINLQVIEIKSTDLEKQLRQVLKDVEINKDLFLSRCLICNDLVSKISKGEVKNKVPKNAFENNDNFFFCKHCNKIYWTGSHTDNMMEKMRKLSASL